MFDYDTALVVAHITVGGEAFVGNPFLLASRILYLKRIFQNSQRFLNEMEPILNSEFPPDQPLAINEDLLFGNAETFSTSQHTRANGLSRTQPEGMCISSRSRTERQDSPRSNVSDSSKPS